MKDYERGKASYSRIIKPVCRIEFRHLAELIFPLRLIWSLKNAVVQLKPEMLSYSSTGADIGISRGSSSYGLSFNADQLLVGRFVVINF